MTAVVAIKDVHMQLSNPAETPMKAEVVMVSASTELRVS